MAAPTFEYFEGEAEDEGITLNLKYQSIEIPFGLRYYIFINDDSKFFINAQYCFDLNINSSVERSNSSADLEFAMATNMAFGLGFKQNDKFSIEARYFTPRNSFRYAQYNFWDSDYKNFSLILGYTLF